MFLLVLKLFYFNVSRKYNCTKTLLELVFTYLCFVQNDYKFSENYVILRGIPVYNELKDHSVFTVNIFK